MGRPIAAASTMLAVLAVVATACSTPGEPAAQTAAGVPSSATSNPTVPVSVIDAPADTAGSGGSTVPQIANDTTTATSPPFCPFQTLAYERIDSALPFPIFMTPVPGTEWSAIATKAGQVWLYDGIDVHGEVFLDIADRVRNDGEQGLLGLAFSPDYETSRRFFVHYSDNRGDTVLAEFVARDVRADSSTETVLFEVEQPAGNHNGGMIQFGPDGHLYMALGDGGRSGDRFGNGQNGSTPLGVLLRFDVSTPGRARPAGAGFDHPTVWSIGLRNPWRFAIDAPSGLIVIADVGQSSFEEVSAAPVSESGLNYGWPITEGLHCFRPSSGCDVEGLRFPVVEVAHGDTDTCSITGGFVYRGNEIPELHGHYFFSDFCGGYLRSFPLEGEVEITDWTDSVGRLGRVASFGTDAFGEIYVLTSDGDILKIVALRG